MVFQELLISRCKIEVFIYFNESESVENIRATRDSLGN